MGVAQRCTYPESTSATTLDNEMYFACLRSSCEDTSDATVSMLSDGDQVSCSSAVVGGWDCNTDISMTIVGVPGSVVGDMCPATCGVCEGTPAVSTTAMSTTTTTVTPTVAITSGTTTVAQQCTYPAGILATASDKEMYFACLRDSCEDTSDATVSMLSGGEETSCSSAVMGSWACNTDISMTVIGVSGSTVSDMCP